MHTGNWKSHFLNIIYEQQQRIQYHLKFDQSKIRLGLYIGT